MRRWLVHQPSSTTDAARRLLSVVAERFPQALTAAIHRKEIGVGVLVRAAHLASQMCRSVETFTTHDTAGPAIVRALLDHLFVRYPVPPWAPNTVVLSSALRRVGEDTRTPCAVLPHIGQGGRFQTAGLPITVSKRLAHHLTTSTTTSPRLALREAQLAVAGVSAPLASSVARSLAHLDFGAVDEAGLVRFFAWLKTVEVPAADISTLVAACVGRLRADADASFGGRSVASIVGEARADSLWGCAAARAYGSFPRSGIGGAWGVDVVVVGAWAFEEMCSGARLADESQNMHHCVALYAPRVASRSIAVFHASPVHGDDTGLTIEVALGERRIVQVRGFANRAPTPAETAALAAWARHVGLQL